VAGRRRKPFEIALKRLLPELGLDRLIGAAMFAVDGDHGRLRRL
jgi:hypothetical protein